jgi:hypothetical protein
MPLYEPKHVSSRFSWHLRLNIGGETPALFHASWYLLLHLVRQNDLIEYFSKFFYCGSTSSKHVQCCYLPFILLDHWICVEHPIFSDIYSILYLCCILPLKIHSMHMPYLKPECSVKIWEVRIASEFSDGNSEWAKKFRLLSRIPSHPEFDPEFRKQSGWRGFRDITSWRRGFSSTLTHLPLRPTPSQLPPLTFHSLGWIPPSKGPDLLPLRFLGDLEEIHRRFLEDFIRWREFGYLPTKPPRRRVSPLS